MNFLGAMKLAGGDIVTTGSSSNAINTADYGSLKINWNKGAGLAPQSDINGDGTVDTLDYGILKGNWNRIGDAE